MNVHAAEPVTDRLPAAAEAEAASSEQQQLFEQLLMQMQTQMHGMLAGFDGSASLDLDGDGEA